MPKPLLPHPVPQEFCMYAPYWSYPTATTACPPQQMFVCFMTGWLSLQEYQPVDMLKPQCRKSYLWIKYLNVSTVPSPPSLYRNPIFMSCGFLKPPS